MSPSRVIESTVLRAVADVSSVPNDPIRGLATIQPDDSFGHVGPAGLPPPLYAWRSRYADPAISSSPAFPSTSATDGPVRNWRSFMCAGKLGLKSPLEGFQAATKSSLPV